MPVIHNPTNENFATVYSGIVLDIHGVCDKYPKGQKFEVTDHHASHVLNIFEKRGLVKLEFGDSENGKQEIKVKAALERNKAFKQKQIINYNNDNDRRQQRQQTYVEPTATVVKYAQELGIELLSPYTVKTKESAQMAAVLEENSDLKNQMALMMDKMSSFIEAAGKTGVELPSDSTDADLDFKTKKNRFYKLGADNFKSWLINDIQEVKAWNDDLKDIVRVKWKKNFPNEKCLLDQG